MEKHIPVRMCVACRKMFPKNELVKVVFGNSEAELDILSKKQGRGAYLCKDLKCLKLAKKKKAFSKHFKTFVPDSIYDDIEEFLNG